MSPRRPSCADSIRKGARPLAQLGLFGNDRRTLLDDATGRIDYLPAAVEPNVAAAWFAALIDTIPWRHERRMMYDREVDVPRLVASYRLPRIATASASVTLSVSKGDEIPSVVLEAAKLGTELAQAPFNSVGLNLYRDGRDSVAPHNDHTDEIAAGFPILLVSLGATRTMTIRSKQRPRRVLDVDLEGGSVLIMSYETQTYYDHGIPKVRAAVEPRISLALRVRKT